jgi:hypothetical protein
MKNRYTVLASLVALAVVGCGGGEFTSAPGDAGGPNGGSVGGSQVTTAGSSSGGSGSMAGSAGSGSVAGSDTVGMAGVGSSDAGGSNEGGSAGAAGSSSKGGDAGSSGSSSNGGSAGSSGSSGSSSNGGSAGLGGAAGAAQGGSSGSAAGGSAGSNQGGTAGLAGSGGATAGAGGTGAGGANGGSGGSGGGVIDPCAGKILCENFDAEPVGVRPMDSPWLTDASCLSSSFVLQTTTSQSVSPGNSLMNAQIPYSACTLHADLGVHSDFYVRARVRFAKGAIPKGNTTQFDNSNVGVFAIGHDTSSDESLRVGFMGSNICPTTGVALDFGDTDTFGCTGYALVPDTWYCMEVHLSTVGITSTARLSINGEAQAFDVQGHAQTALSDTGLLSMRYLNIGTRTFGNPYTAPVFIDDVVASTQPIGCN